MDAHENVEQDDIIVSPRAPAVTRCKRIGFALIHLRLVAHVRSLLALRTRHAINQS